MGPINAAGDLLSLTDGKNQTTRWHYDEYGRVTNKLDQAGMEILRYQYDPGDRLTNRWSAAKLNTGYAYDPVGNLTNIHYPAWGTIQFTYDSMNRLATMVDGVGTTVYGYDATGQLLTEDGPFARDTVTNTYVNRLRMALSLQQPVGAWTNGFGWDAARRLTNVTSPAGGFTYTYTGVGQVASPARLVQELALPNGAYVTNTFDSVARLLITRLNNSSGSALDGYAYLYDPANERTNLTRADNSTVAYGYDLIGQLKTANSSTNVEDCGYTYDAAWNMGWRTNSAGLTQYTYDIKNELARINGQYLNYDLNGNLVTNPVTALGYVYDDENRLIEVYHLPPGSPGPLIPQPTGGWKSDFAYDGLGRMRVRRDYYSYGTPVSWYLTNTTEYVHDGLRVIQERDVNNTPTVSSTRGADLSGTLEGAGGIGGLLARSTGYGSGWNSHSYYYADGNGNITYMVDASQAMVASYRYDPFGNMIAKSGTLADANLYRFSSKAVHVYSGLYYYLYRFYDPNLQRWVNRDPVAEFGGINLYEYVGNSPTRFLDQLGLDYYVTYITAYSGYPHQVVIGDNGSGGTYVIDYGPANGGLNRVYGPGKYDYTPYSYPPNQSAYDLSKARCTKTSPTVDKALNDLASGLGANYNTPNYCFLGNNCWSTASIFDTTAGNYQNFGTPYSPINTQRNLPPPIIIR